MCLDLALLSGSGMFAA
uniref:Uncharacterized protein n=1 Tax=Arundo donax TaxID=35708 RepID=A0A0A9FHK4_ARUDO